MNVVFFGNTKFSLIGARIIHEKLGLSHIVTLPDRPDKRGRMKPNPLKIFAQEKNIPFLTIDKIDKETISYLSTIHADFFIVEDYGLILPQALLDLPKFTSLNIHHSLLPKYRGPSPAPFAILAGDTVTGVTVIKMAKNVDAGDILAQKQYDMKPEETTESLLTILNQLGGEIIIPVIENYASMTPQLQDNSSATYTKMITKEDGYIDLSKQETLNPVDIDRKIRAYFPWPTVWTKWEMPNGKWKIIKFLPKDKLQVEGKNPVSSKDFFNGYPQMREKFSIFFNSIKNK